MPRSKRDRAQFRPRSRRMAAHVPPEQLPLLEPVEVNGEEVMAPVCGGCGKCAGTPLARSPRAQTQKP
jgi:hypothetical protein